MARISTYIHALVLACALAAGPAASTASADHGTPYQSPTLTRYLQIAEAHWGAPAPTCPGRGGEPVGVHAVLFDDPHPDVSAVAEQPGCRIWLDRDFWPAADDETDCTIIAHEWGHLLGNGHSDDERGLMYEAPEHGAPGCGVFGQPVMAPVAVKEKRKPIRAVKHKTAPRRCARRSKAGRSGRGAKRGHMKCKRPAPSRGSRSR